MPSPLNVRSRVRDALVPMAQALVDGAVDGAAPPLPPAMNVEVLDRADNAGSTASARTGASMINALSGLGMGRDSGSTTRPNVDREYLQYEELVAMMRGGLYRRIVHLVPDWATWKGWTVTDESDEAEPLAQEMKDLKIQHAVRQADRLARGYSEALLWPVTAGDRGRLDRPLRMASVKAVRAVHVLDVSEFSVASWQTDPEKPGWGMPESYYIHPRRQGVSVTERIHASRVCYFGGDPLPPTEWGMRFVGAGGAGMSDAIGQVMWDALRNMAGTSAAGAKLAQELSVAVFTIKNLAAKKGGDQRATLFNTVRLINVLKSVANAVLLQDGDTYQRVAANPTGFKDLSQDARLQLALITGVPAALLFGEAPSGLSTDEKSWWASWTATISQHQEDRYRSCLEWIIEMLYVVKYGQVPDQWSLGFDPLGELSERDLAEIRKLNSESDGMDIKNGILSPARIRRSRYGPEGYQHSIQPPTPEEEREEAEMKGPAGQQAEAPPAPGAGDPGEVTPPGQAPGEEDDPAVGEVQDRADAGADSAILFLEMPVGVGFEGAQIAAQGVLGGELEVESWPHVTVLYLGKLGSAVSAVRAAADATVKDFLKETKTRIDLMPARIGHFGDGTPGPDGVPVIIHYYSWGLEELQNALLRRLADKVNVPQFPRFIPHATLGYLPREMTSEESAALANLQTDGLRDWAPMTLALRVGEEVVARIPLVSGRVDEE